MIRAKELDCSHKIPASGVPTGCQLFLDIRQDLADSFEDGLKLIDPRGFSGSAFQNHGLESHIRKRPAAPIDMSGLSP
jgi:hypothetical protein